MLVGTYHKGVCIFTAEECLGRNEGPNEGGDTVPALTELETSRCSGGVTDDDSVGIGGRLQGCKTAGDHKGACQETTKGSLLVLRCGEMSDWPEKDSTQGIQSKAHQDGDFVTLALEDFGSNRREAEVATAKVHNLKTGGLETGNAEYCLEMLVEDIEQSVTEAPEEEEGDDQAEWNDELLSC